MALSAGNSDCTTGLSKAIYDARVAASATIGLSANAAPIKADCFAIATAVVDYIKANAVITVASGIVTSCSAGAGSTTTSGTGTIA